ncbi:MAG: AAA family ATPase [Clostridia bacterium]|nr:AAA family ATPase [Clostridia bacterium]
MKVVIELSGNWVLSRKADLKLPIAVIEEALQLNFGKSVRVCTKSFTALIFELEDGSSITEGMLNQFLSGLLVEKYGVSELDKVAVLRVEKASNAPSNDKNVNEENVQPNSGWTDFVFGKKQQEDLSSNEDEEFNLFKKGGKVNEENSSLSQATQEQAATDGDQDKAEDDSGIFKKGGQSQSLSQKLSSAKNEEGSELKAEKESLLTMKKGPIGGDGATGGDRAQKVLEKIDSLVGADEFKRLMHEIYEVAPIIKQNGTAQSFQVQSYLFSISEGAGLTTCITLFAELISALNLKRISGVKEVKIEPQIREEINPFDNALREICTFGAESKLIAINITDWMSSFNNAKMRNFLQTVNKLKDNIYVFNIPFLDDEAVDRVKQSLSDMMFIRCVTFAPLDMQQITKCAKMQLEQFKYTATTSEWQTFRNRIVEEKSDGKFYGFNTIGKVVNEMLYAKQLACAKSGVNDKVITKKDVADLCKNANYERSIGLETLDKMVGGSKIKQRIEEIISQITVTRSSDKLQSPCIHMRFVGNPGTGKTTVARIVGKVLKEKGVLRLGNFFEYTGRDFCGRYVGETAPKTSAICRDAYGSVLFIDEAYSLYREGSSGVDYGREALDTLIAEMENHRTDLVVIMAGYTDEMDKLMEGNAGLASRMPYVIEFPNFTKEELAKIFMSMVGERFNYDEKLEEAVKNYFNSLSDELLKSKSFANARYVRNLFERTWAKAAMRCRLGKAKTVTVIKEDFEIAISDKEFRPVEKKKTTIGFR